MGHFASFIAVIWSVILVGSAVGRDPDWYCDFSRNDCNMVQGHGSGTWRIQYGYYYVQFDSSVSSVVEFTLPLSFQAARGILSFQYYSSLMNSRMEIRVCDGGQYAPIGHSFFLKTVNWLISCPSKISISFRAWKTCAWIHWSPGLDNIEVYIDSPFTTDSSSTSEKSTTTTATDEAETPLPLLTSTSPSSSYQTPTATTPHILGPTSPVFNDETSKVMQTSVSESTSVALSYTTEQGTPNVQTTPGTSKSDSNLKMQNRDGKGGAEGIIISVVVVGILFLAIVTAIFLNVLRHRRMARQNNRFPEFSKQPSGKVYNSAAFSSSGVDTDQPDIIRDVRFIYDLEPPYPSPSLTNPGGSNSHFHADGYIAYEARDSSAIGEDKYADLKDLDGSTDHSEKGKNGYSALERLGGMDSDGQQRAEESNVLVEQVYDHLNHYVKSTDDQEQLLGNFYGTAAVLSDEGHYNSIERKSESEFNQRRSKDITNPKKTATKGAQGVEDKYQTLGPIDEKNLKRPESMNEMNYNFLGETVDIGLLDGNEISPNAFESDNTTRDDYHILHSEKELCDYHEYHYPAQPWNNDSTNNFVSVTKGNQEKNHYCYEGRGDEGNNEQLRAKSSYGDDDEQTYDHLNRDSDNINGHQEQMHEKTYGADDQEQLRGNLYGTAAVLSDEGHYNSLERKSEAEFNQTRSKDMTNQKKTATKGAQGVEDEYQIVGPIGEKNLKRPASMNGKNYNFLGETVDVDPLDGNEISPNAFESDNTTRDDYNILHSGKELCESHEYHYPGQPWNNDSTNNFVSVTKGNQEKNHYCYGRRGDGGNNEQLRAENSYEDDDEQTYDHLNRGRDNINGHLEQMHESTYGADDQEQLRGNLYGTAGVLSDEGHYNTLERQSEVEFNQRRSKVMKNPKKTASKGARDIEGEYQKLGPVDEKESKLPDDIDENTYNVLGQTVDNLHQNGISLKTSESDTTTKDDYHILHSGKELGDYHEYHYPGQPWNNDSTNNFVSVAKGNQENNHYCYGRGGDDGNNEQLRAESSYGDDDEQTYDHLNRDSDNVNGHQEQMHENTYGAAAVLSDKDHYESLVYGSEAVVTQRKLKDMKNPKKTASKGARAVEDEYHTLSPVDEKKSKLPDNIDENTYNVLGETVDSLHQNGISLNTSESDNTPRNDYRIQHSGKELGDYHEYQYPDQPLFSGSTANSVSLTK